MSNRYAYGPMKAPFSPVVKKKFPLRITNKQRRYLNRGVGKSLDDHFRTKEPKFPGTWTQR